MTWVPSERRTCATPPPRTPTIIGSTTVNANSAVTAASIALPPSSRISAPAADARRVVGDDHAPGPTGTLLLTRRTGRSEASVVRTGLAMAATIAQFPDPVPRSGRHPAGPANLDCRRLRSDGYVLAMASQFPIRFGWLSPCIGNRWSDHRPIVVDQAKTILPTVNDHFDSMWVADHFYGFDAKTDPFVEAWTSLTWLAAKFPDVMLCHHVLGHGYRPPALTAKMAATLQVFSENRFMLGIGAGWRGDEYQAYGYEFPKAGRALRAARGGGGDLPVDVDRGSTQLRGHVLLDHRGRGSSVARGRSAGLHRGERRADRSAIGRPDRRHVAQQQSGRERLASQARHRAGVGRGSRPRS